MEQAGSIDKLGLTILDILKQIKQNADDVRQVNEMVGSVVNGMVNSQQKMQAMTTAMNENSESSRQIQLIINTIEGIVMQSRILALNASVEAARAVSSNELSNHAAQLKQLVSKFPLTNR